MFQLSELRRVSVTHNIYLILPEAFTERIANIFIIVIFLF